MRTVGISEAKNQLSALVAAVERGESITLTRNGKPVAELRPAFGNPVDAVRRIRERRGLRMSATESLDAIAAVTCKKGGVAVGMYQRSLVA